MGRKGELPESFKDGKIDKYNFRNRTPEEMQEIVRKSHETRKENKRKKMELQNCMRSILDLGVQSEKQRKVLKSFGITDKKITNKVLLMVSLYMKGVKGDVQAIREIVNMMDRLDILEDTGNITQGININLVPVQSKSEQEQQELLDEDAYWDLEDESEDWGEDIYKP